MTRPLSGGVAGAGGGAGGDDLSPQVVIGSLADLDQHAPAVGGVRTIDFAGFVTNPEIVLLPGETFAYGENGILASTSAFGGGFVFDVDAPAMTGPIVMDGIGVTQLNTGANAWCAKISTTMGRFVVVDTCFFTGIRGVWFNTILGVAIMTGCGIGAGILAVRIDGQIFVVQHRLLGVSQLQPGGIAIEIPATASILPGGSIFGTSPGFALEAGQWGHAIDTNAVVPAGTLIQLTGAAVSGQQGTLFRQDPGDMPIDDDRLLVSGSSSDNWVAILDASRTDLVSPLLVPYPAFPAAAPTPIPYSTGAGLEIEIVSSAHWVMVKDDPSPGDLYFEYVGEKANTGHVLGMSLLADRNAGTGPLDLLWERDTLPPTDTWSTIDTTVTPADNTNSFRTQMGTSGDAVFNKGDRVRPSSQNLADAVSARLYSIKLSIRGA